MRYVKGIVSNSNVQELIVSNESIIGEVINVVTPRLLVANSKVVKGSLGMFIEGDLLDTFENIRAFAEDDMSIFIGCIADVIADQHLNNEEKIKVINFTLDDSTDGMEDEILEGLMQKGLSAASWSAKRVKAKLADDGVVDTAKAVGKTGYRAAKVVGKNIVDQVKQHPGKVTAAGVGAAALGYGAYKGAKAIKAKIAARKAKKK